MKCNILAICDSQTIYADFLTKQILRMKEEVFQVCRFATVEQLLAFSKGQKIACLLLSEEYESAIEQIKANQYFCFCNQQSRDRDREGKIQYIYRYQSLEIIYGRILEHHQEEILLEEDTGVMLIGVYNPVHRNGQTLFARALAQEYGRVGKSVLYLNLEEYAGVMPDQGSEGLGEILYHLKKDVKSINYRLASFTRKEGNYEYIEPILMSQELRKVSGEEWITFLTEIIEGGGYRVIVLDLDSCIQDLFQILEMCKTVYMPIRKEVGGEEKRKQFFYNLEMLQKSELKEKIRQIEIPTFQNLSQGDLMMQIGKVILEEGRM